jgi:hypothetical protein
VLLRRNKAACNASRRRYIGLMSRPVVVDLPHRLGAEEAKRRMREGIGRLPDHIPGGGQVESRWEGDRMHLRVGAMGQEVSGHIDVFEKKVTVELALPAILGLFADKISGVLRQRGGELLEDRSNQA